MPGIDRESATLQELNIRKYESGQYLPRWKMAEINTNNSKIIRSTKFITILLISG